MMLRSASHLCSSRRLPARALLQWRQRSQSSAPVAANGESLLYRDLARTFMQIEARCQPKDRAMTPHIRTDLWTPSAASEAVSRHERATAGRAVPRRVAALVVVAVGARVGALPHGVAGVSIERLRGWYQRERDLTGIRVVAGAAARRRGAALRHAAVRTGDRAARIV